MGGGTACEGLYRGNNNKKFIFEYVLTRFGCPKILMSDRGTHFLNETISALMEEFQGLSSEEYAISPAG
jgi:hypothetical protein